MVAVKVLPSNWSTSVALADLGERVEELLGPMVRHAGHWVVLAEDARRRYVQLLVERDGSILAEAVSNNHLAPADAWSEADEGRLTRLGWEPPCLPERPNWNLLFPRRRPDIAHVSALVMCTMRDPFLLEDTDVLVLTVTRAAIAGPGGGRPAVAGSPYCAADQDARSGIHV
jgi:hypothetical protein